MPSASQTPIAGLIRLVHPFPIALDALASGAVALLAGGDGVVAVRLGLAMLALQASIGALNDLVDAPIDAGRKPAKPIPVGLVTPAAARVVATGSAVLGLFLAALSGPGLLILAGLVLAVGFAYDLAAKGTAWSWVPFAVGIPLLPVFGWYGAVGGLPALFAVLIPAAVLGGAALAIANATADMDRDISAGVGSVAVRLGRRLAWMVGALLQGIVGLIALGSLLSTGAQFTAVLLAGLSWALVLAGVALGRAASPRALERAWEVQAIGVAALAVSWLWGAVGSAWRVGP